MVIRMQNAHESIHFKTGLPKDLKKSECLHNRVQIKMSTLRR